MGLVTLWWLTTCPNIQLSFMADEHVAEMKYLFFKV